jgi:hypothetical protein
MSNETITAMHLGHLQLTRQLALAQPDDGLPAAEAVIEDDGYTRSELPRGATAPALEGAHRLGRAPDLLSQRLLGQVALSAHPAHPPAKLPLVRGRLPLRRSSLRIERLMLSHHAVRSFTCIGMFQTSLTVCP